MTLGRRLGPASAESSPCSPLEGDSPPGAPGPRRASGGTASRCALLVLAVLVVACWIVELAVPGTLRCAREGTGRSRVTIDVLRSGPTVLVVGGVLLLGMLVASRLRGAARSPERWVVVGSVVCVLAAAGPYVRTVTERLQLS
jgi:hypothetical protein